MLQDQRHGTARKGEFGYDTAAKDTVFDSDSKKVLFKAALNSENRKEKLKTVVGEAPRLELKVSL